jgi:hypothetical protein
MCIYPSSLTLQGKKKCYLDSFYELFVNPYIFFLHFRLGLGAPLPQQGAADGSWNRTELSSNDKLRQQLLGKNYRKNIGSIRTGATSRTSNTATATTGNLPSDDEEEQGRSAVGRSKKGSGGGRNAATEYVSAAEDKDNEAKNNDHDGNNNNNNGAGKSIPKRTAAAASSKGKRAGNFLDELLSDRSKKRGKRQK